MSGYAFHPEALADLTGIWEYIAEDNIDAADDVVNSLTSESFKSPVAARIAGTSRSPPSASPDPPPRVSLNRVLRLIVEPGAPLPSTGLSGIWIGASCDSSMALLRAIADKKWCLQGQSV